MKVPISLPHPTAVSKRPTRRALVGAGLGVIGWMAVYPAVAQPALAAAPSAAPSDSLAGAVLSFTSASPTREGRVHLEIAALVDNGNTVPITVSVDSPMTPDNHVTAIAVFNERNPQREVIKARLTPAAGKAVLSSRIRLATSQKLVAIARMSDGSFWTHTVDVIVTLAACIEES